MSSMIPDPVTVQVTQKDIDRGEGHSLIYNPVALAIARVQGGGVASVYSSNILSTLGGFETPDIVCHFITAFNQGIYPPPFQFTMEPDSEYWMPSSWWGVEMWDRENAPIRLFDWRSQT